MAALPTPPVAHWMTRSLDGLLIGDLPNGRTAARACAAVTRAPALYTSITGTAEYDWMAVAVNNGVVRRNADERT